MKEQVSVDKCMDCGNTLTTDEAEFLINTCNECEIKSHNVLVREKEWHGKRHGLAKKIYVDMEEYDRLKRLDEIMAYGITLDEVDRLKRLDNNVQKLITELKLIDGETTPSSLGKLLQGLYK
jgi:DNA-directed RNA polymerase subunit RPC12/RpoP